MPRPLETSIATFDETTITWRGLDLVMDILGKHSFTEMIYFLMRGHLPDQTQTRVLDLCLITLMEHGMTPHAIVARLTRMCNPEQVQVAMAAGLACVGDQFAGTMDGCGRLIAAGLAAEDQAAFCTETVGVHRTAKRPVPGFGHNLHKPDDPRSPRLFELAREAGVKGDAIAFLQRLSAEIDRQAGRHLTINATGAIAALMLEIDIPVPAMRSLAVLSRAGGLAAHLAEDSETRSSTSIWLNVENDFTYRGDA
ncbi:MAG: citryl-CoA lyase [Pseudomonadota bacterium]|nr:citryl-CoA lyase [Pseudomonadota bacterium]MEE2859668.1 citryl-CoA lyase [Pseudomonadota bacterium]